MNIRLLLGPLFFLVLPLYRQNELVVQCCWIHCAPNLFTNIGRHLFSDDKYDARSVLFSWRFNVYTEHFHIHVSAYWVLSAQSSLFVFALLFFQSQWKSYRVALTHTHDAYIKSINILFVFLNSWLYIIHRREERYIQGQKTEMNGSAPGKTDGNQNPVFVISDECMEKPWMNVNRMRIEIMTIFKIWRTESTFIYYKYGCTTLFSKRRHWTVNCDIPKYSTYRLQFVNTDNGLMFGIIGCYYNWWFQFYFNI